MSNKAKMYDQLVLAFGKARVVLNNDGFKVHITSTTFNVLHSVFDPWEDRVDVSIKRSGAGITLIIKMLDLEFLNQKQTTE